MLYRDYASLVLRRARRFVGPSEAEEIVHEVFLKVMETAHQFRAESSPVTWLYSVTTRHCLNKIRDQGRRQELLDTRAIDIPAPSVPSDADTTLFLKELWSSLPADLALVGTYHFLDGLSHAEIAPLVGCSPRTVGNRLAELTARARAFGESGPKEEPTA